MEKHRRCVLLTLVFFCWRQASLMINETAQSPPLSGGAVQFQANQAVEDLGALAYVSSGEP